MMLSTWDSKALLSSRMVVYICTKRFPAANRMFSMPPVQDGDTPCHDAARLGYKGCIEALIRGGFVPDTVNHVRRLPKTSS